MTTVDKLIRRIVREEIAAATEPEAHGSTSEETHMDDPMRSIDELAEQLQVKSGTVYRWNHLGTGPAFYRIGKHVRYKQSVIDAWIETQAHRPQPAT